jgi:hypothetical protein
VPPVPEDEDEAPPVPEDEDEDEAPGLEEAGGGWLLSPQAQMNSTRHHPEAYLFMGNRAFRCLLWQLGRCQSL